jgi:hypothetical protein
MNESTQGVTLIAGFVFDVLGEYAWARRSCGAMFDLAAHLDPKRPEVLVPISLYNSICAQAEELMGRATLERAGRNIGNRVYETLLKQGALGAEPTPLTVMQGLQRVASTLIQDPAGRGWDLLGFQEGRVSLRRTQTFNCTLQHGLLMSLVERTGVPLPTVTQTRCTRQGAPFCEYDVKWVVTRRAASAA